MLHLTFRQLRIFESVARNLSYSRAAEELHLTQPAVSMQVKQLEENVGLPLFEQIGKKIHLTVAGHEVYRYSHNIARQLKLAEQTLEDLKGLRRGRLNIAIVSTAKYFAPRLLGKFSHLHPGMDLKLSDNNREAVIEQLSEYEIDLAIMGRPPQDIDVVAEPFAKHPHVVVAAPDHPLAGKRRIKLARIAEETFLMREPGSGTRQNLERLFAEKGLLLKAGMEMSSNETIKQAVMARLGVSFLSLHTIGLELQAERLVSLDVAGLPIVRNWYVVHRKDKRLSPVATAFREFLLREGAEILTAEYDHG
ncbi:MAG: LysR family transcriptional regulator [Burkholderiales bacterium]|nr:LysR family transcriptional regulator [Burkholderiales bacterium]